MGGNVFDCTSPIKKIYIRPTVQKFKEELSKLFPFAAKSIFSVVLIGSAGKKDISGDIDLAMSNYAVTDDWGLNMCDIKERFDKFKKRSRSSSDSQLYKRTIISLISEAINDKSDLIISSDKQSSNGVLFCNFPQFDQCYNKTDLRVQIDINIGNLDWLKFAYYSDEYKHNIKGLHRTQLMLALFGYKGYIFSHNYGVKKKENNEIVAITPYEAKTLLNDEYRFIITDKILSNYFELQNFLKVNLCQADLYGVYDRYLKALDSTKCDIPEDLQSYWMQNQDRLGLKGKFLPEDSNLYILRKC